MPSSTFQNKESIGRKRYMKLKVVSSSTSSLKKPSYGSIIGDVEVFDNGTMIVRNKKGDWFELE